MSIITLNGVPSNPLMPLVLVILAEMSYVPSAKFEAGIYVQAPPLLAVVVPRVVVALTPPILMVL